MRRLIMEDQGLASTIYKRRNSVKEQASLPFKIKMTDASYERPTSDEMGYYPNDDESKWNLDNFYFNSERRRWVARPQREPLIVFFGLPLVRTFTSNELIVQVDRGWNPKYSTMYQARYDLRGNSNKVATEEHNEIKFTHCDFST